jgi:EPS-associated MarR family transcriptional regulator
LQKHAGLFPLDTSPRLLYVHRVNEKIDREIRYRLLKLLSENPKMTQRDLSAEMGISLGKVNYCLSELTRKGLIKINRFKGAKKKTNYLYKLTPYGLEEKARVTVSFLRQKQREYEEIKRQIEELEKEAETVQTLKTENPTI